MSEGSVLVREALTKVQKGGSALSKGPGLLALPLGEPDIGNGKFSSFKHPKLLRGGLGYQSYREVP